MADETSQVELPRWKCHKEVRALKIAKIDRGAADGSAMIIPEDGIFSPFGVSTEYMAKHEPEVGGYYVVYEDGYKSFSPAAAFEAGYTCI